MGLLGGLLSGVFGGGGNSTSGDDGIANSKSTDTTTNTTTSSNSDSRRAFTGGAGVNAAEGSTINYTSNSIPDKAFDIVDTVIGKTLANVSASEQNVANAYADAKGNGALTTQMIVALVVVVGGIAYLVTHKKG